MAEVTTATVTSRMAGEFTAEDGKTYKVRKIDGFTAEKLAELEARRKSGEIGPLGADAATYRIAARLVVGASLETILGTDTEGGWSPDELLAVIALASGPAKAVEAALGKDGAAPAAA
jgi:hypothetical protein